MRRRISFGHKVIFVLFVFLLVAAWPGSGRAPDTSRSGPSQLDPAEKLPVPLELRGLPATTASRHCLPVSGFRLELHEEHESR